MPLERVTMHHTTNDIGWWRILFPLHVSAWLHPKPKSLSFTKREGDSTRLLHCHASKTPSKWHCSVKEDACDVSDFNYRVSVTIVNEAAVLYSHMEKFAIDMHMMNTSKEVTLVPLLGISWQQLIGWNTPRCDNLFAKGSYVKRLQEGGHPLFSHTPDRQHGSSPYFNPWNIFCSPYFKPGSVLNHMAVDGPLIDLQTKKGRRTHQIQWLTGAPNTVTDRCKEYL